MGFYRGPKIVTNGLVLYLDAANKKSYPGTGTTWTDLSGFGNNGTLTNGPTFNSANGGRIILDGVNDYISLQSVNLSLTNKVTISFFCKLLDYSEITNGGKLLLEVTSNFNNKNTGLVIGYADDSNSLYLRTFPISIALRGDVGYNISGFNKNLVNDLKWHYWTCIFDKSQTGTDPQETFLYIDGVYQVPTIIPSSAYRSNNTNNFDNEPINIGLRPPTVAPSNLELSCLQIYNRVLSTSEVLQNYNATKGRFNL